MSDVEIPRREVRRAAGALTLLRVEILLLTMVPAGLVIRPLGQVGSPALLLGMLLLGLWACVVLTPGFGVRRCVPVRLALFALTAVTLISYAVLHGKAVPGVEVRSADGFLCLVAAFAGVALTAAEGLRSRAELLAVVRTAVWGAAFSAVVALLQFRPGFDIASWLAKIPVLEANRAVGEISNRGSFNRPPGTAIHPIEFGVVTATALAFALHLLLYDHGPPRWQRRLAFGVLALGIPISISRSALLVSVIIVGYFILGAPPALRVRAGAFLVGFTLFVFVAVPGLLGTLKGLVFAGQSDSSISTRTSDYGVVARYIRPNPWFGRGPGTFLPSYRVLDNQYLLTLIEIGITGLLCLVGVLATTSCLGRSARRHFSDEGDRNLSQMFAAVGAAALVSLFTFDSLSFPTFTGYSALWLGLAGAWWRLAPGEGRQGPDGDSEAGLARPSRSTKSQAL